MTSPLLVRDLTVSFRGRTLIDKATFQIATDERVALLRASGSGKSLTAAAVLGQLPAGMNCRRFNEGQRPGYPFAWTRAGRSGRLRTGAEVNYVEWLGWFSYVVVFNVLGGILLVTALRLVSASKLMKERRDDSPQNPEDAHSG